MKKNHFGRAAFTTATSSSDGWAGDASDESLADAMDSSSAADSGSRTAGRRMLLRAERVAALLRSATDKKSSAPNGADLAGMMKGLISVIFRAASIVGI